jgi:hypothetical protein
LVSRGWIFASPLILPPGSNCVKKFGRKKRGQVGSGSSMIVTIGAGVPRNPHVCRVNEGRGLVLPQIYERMDFKIG